MLQFSTSNSGSRKSTIAIHLSWNLNSIFLILSLVIFLLLTNECNGKADSYGLGDHFDWVTLDEGYELAKNGEKPLMLIIHKSWCGACKALKPKIKESTAIHELSKSFVLVNVQDDDEPEGDVYQPDGGYIPRILFFDHDGQLLQDIINEDGNPKYKYYYSSVESIVKSMKTVLKMYSETQDSKDQQRQRKNSTKHEL